jgi:outer membrane immunogenic protein
MRTRGFVRGRSAARVFSLALSSDHLAHVRQRVGRPTVAASALAGILSRLFAVMAAIAAAGVLVTPVAAADRGVGGDPPDYLAEEFSWTGLYFGGHAGYGWADWDGKLETTAGCPDACPVDAGFTMPFHTLSDDGYIGGLQAGYNLQSASGIVLGVEADVSWADIDATGTFDTDKYNPSVWSKKHDLSLDYFGTARARVGYAMGRFLPYVTGGLAWGHTSGDLGVTYIPPAGVGGTSYASVDEMHLGWVIGVGAEIALAKNWTLKAEHLHMDLGKQDYLFEGSTYFDTPFDTDSFPSNLTVGTVKVGINYLYN